MSPLRFLCRRKHWIGLVYHVIPHFDPNTVLQSKV
ncbi:hypothetical protein BsWGS_27186 [Bradybaena similaris]